MEIVILIGLQASGKSTFARSRFADHVYVSKDAMGRAKQKDRRQEAMIRQAFAEGRNVIVDNTNPSVEVRAPLIALGREYGARIVGYYFQSRMEACQARNRQREGRACVPDVALYATRRKLEPPSCAEGFDALFFVRIDADRHDFIVTPWQEASEE